MTAIRTRLEIGGIAAGGDGVARTEGMVVFVPRTAPGDVVDAHVTAVKRFGRGLLERVEIASLQRTDPLCAHYVVDHCGGCQLQHMQYDAQVAAKRTIIGDSLRRIARRAAEDPEVEGSAAQWRYRRKLTLHLRWTGREWIAGLHRYDDPAAVFDLADCPITDERVLAVWAELRAAFEHLPRERELRASVRVTEDGAVCVLEGGRAWESYDRFFIACPSLSELWWQPEKGRRRRVATRAAAASSGGASFVQVNAGMAARLREHVLGRARSYEPRHVVDAYAGMGATSLPLAGEGIRVTAIELDADAVASFSSRLRAPSRAIAGRVEEHIAAALPAEVVLLNPPRAGIDAAVASALQEGRWLPRTILYTSCDPATLARDVARMPRYRVAAVRGYDMFPQTAHVETVCELVPEAA